MTNQLPDATNEEISEWCGPKPGEPGPSHVMTPIKSPCGFWWWTRLEWVPRYNFRESSDACAEFERLVGERGRDLAQAYRDAVRDVALEMFSKPVVGPWEKDWLLIRATAPQRCAALLKVIKG